MPEDYPAKKQVKTWAASAQVVFETQLGTMKLKPQNRVRLVGTAEVPPHS